MGVDSDNQASTDLDQKFLEKAVLEVQSRAKVEQVQSADGSWPVTECSCGEPLHPVRLSLGKVRCVACQSLLEKGIPR